MLIATAVKSTVNGWLTLTGFPALLCPATSTVNGPAGQALTFAAGMPTLQLPSACTVVEYATLLMVTVSTAPAFRPLLPPVITSACPCSILLTISSPATVSTRRPGRLASMVISREPLPVLPFALVTEALMVKSPLPNAWRSAAGTLILQLKLPCTVVV